MSANEIQTLAKAPPMYAEAVRMLAEAPPVVCGRD